MTLIGISLGSAYSTKAAFGDPDVTFGSNGVFTDSLQYIPQAMARQGDGKILVVGHFQDYAQGDLLILRRYNSNGTIDTTFGSGGTAIPYNQNGTGYDVFLQLDGKIIVVGSSTWRFNSNGWYDGSFGYFGKVSLSGTAGALYQPLRSSPPKIILMSVTNGSVIYRLNSNGSLDTSFGSNGSVSVPIQTSGFVVKQGSIFVSGNMYGQGAIAKYTINGQPDLSFGNQGIALHGDAESRAFFGCGGGQSDSISYGSIVVQGSGRIIARVVKGGTPSIPGYIWSFVGNDASGNLDASFLMNSCTSPYNPYVPLTIVQSDDRLLDHPSGIGLPINRYTATGTPDGQFSFSQDFINDMLEQPDGKIVLSGTHQVGQDTFVMLSRHLPL